MLKAIAKKVIRRDHYEFLSWYRSRFGFLPTIRSYINMLSNQGIGSAPNYLTGASLYLRPGTTDQVVYDEVFIKKVYEIDLGNPMFIVVAGAHIGLASVFFSCKYPKATIVALEPERGNFDILLMNTKGYSNVMPLQAGLWNRKTYLRIQNYNVATWSFRVLEDPSNGGIPAVGIRNIMSDFNATQIDVLKIDIEGSELEVLTYDNSWIDEVRTLIIELHDRFRPGCSEALERALSGYDYCRSISGESIVITNLRRTAKLTTA